MNKHIIAHGAGFVVHPTGDQNLDLANIQWALDHAQPGATVTLKHYALGAKQGNVTPFDLGDTGIVYVTQDVRLEGEVLHREAGQRGVKNGTTILNGRQLQWGRSPAGMENPISASVKDIRFKGFSGGAIRIAATRNANEILGCSFVEYRKGTTVSGNIVGAFPIVADNPANPDLLGGSLRISECYFGEVLVPAGEDPATFAKGTNNAMHVSNCSLDLDFSDNEIAEMYWVGIAVYGNKGHTTIARNTIRKSASFVFEGAAIAFGVRPRFNERAYDGDATIEKNTITVGSTNSYAIVMALFAPNKYVPPAPVSHVTVRDNLVKMKPSKGNVTDRAALACLGACSQSTWTGNIVEGSGRYGIHVTGSLPDFMTARGMIAGGEPSENTFSGNHLAGGTLTDPIGGKKVPFSQFEAADVQACLEQGFSIEFSSNSFGPVLGANAAAPAVPTPPDQRAAILYRGRSGLISLNDFAGTKTAGWPVGPKYLGCIYLAEGSEDNRIEYVNKNFPPATVPPVEYQIFDAGLNNSAQELTKTKGLQKGKPAPAQFAKPGLRGRRGVPR
jgi:hypothetical protein